MNELTGARVLMKDEKRQFTLAWFGGHGIHVYGEDGQEVAFWTVGPFDKNDADQKKIVESMTNRIKTGEYP